MTRVEPSFWSDNWLVSYQVLLRILRKMVQRGKRSAIINDSLRFPIIINISALAFALCNSNMMYLKCYSLRKKMDFSFHVHIGFHSLFEMYNLYVFRKNLVESMHSKCLYLCSGNGIWTYFALLSASIGMSGSF